MILASSAFAITLYSGLMAGDLTTTELALRGNPQARELSPLGQSIQGRILAAAASDALCIYIDSRLSRNHNKTPLWAFRIAVTSIKLAVIANNIQRMRR